MRRISAIYNDEISVGESVSFEYRPPCETKALGLLISNDLETSLSFHSGTDLKLLRFMSDSNSDSSPNARIIPFSEKINGSIRGVVSSLLNRAPRKEVREKHKVGIYLISQTNEN